MAITEKKTPLVGSCATIDVLVEDIMSKARTPSKRLRIVFTDCAGQVNVGVVTYEVETVEKLRMWLQTLGFIVRWHA